MYLPLLWPHLPCLIGSYERELFSTWQQIFAIEFQRFVNVGTADGYYAVGVARARQSVIVEAFEGNAAKRLRIARMARSNGVCVRVRIRGFCGPQRSLSPHFTTCRVRITLILMDIDGGEGLLLDPEAVPELTFAHLLVEIHEGHGPKADENGSAIHTH